MDWLFETTHGLELADTIGNGLLQQSQSDGDLGEMLSNHSKGVSFDDDMQFGSGDYDTMPTYPGDPETPEEPPIDPTTHPEPLEPTGPIFDYSTILTVADLLAWLEWRGGSGPTDIGGGNYDSLEEFLNGEWHFEIDPELIDEGGFYGSHNQGGLIVYGSHGGTNSIVGFTTPGGMLVPIFREWTEVIEVPADQAGDLPGMTVIHHTDFLGYRSSNTYQVASLDDPQVWMGRAEGVLNAADVAQAYANLLAAARGEENTVAIGEPFISQANGMLMSEVTLNGELIGHVQVNDSGLRMFDRNGNLLDVPTVLPQHWDTIGGVTLAEQLVHQERTMGIPFAQGIVALATVFTGGMMGFFTSLGFGFASSVVTGGSAANQTACARLLEAAFELRLVELRSRNGG